MGNKRSILVIDDEPSVADALEMILDDHGYNVVVASNGRDGLEAASRQRFDLVITDLRLPDISGLEILSSIRGMDPANLVIIITAHSTPELVAESLSLGALDVLSKPFFPADVLKLIESALDDRQSLPM